MKLNKSKNIDVKQLKQDMTNLSEEQFRAKYHISINTLKGLSDQELNKRVSKFYSIGI